jgi:hypothetical protein
MAGKAAVGRLCQQTKHGREIGQKSESKKKCCHTIESVLSNAKYETKDNAILIFTLIISYRSLK